jgi:hypothetical protein
VRVFILKEAEKPKTEKDGKKIKVLLDKRFTRGQYVPKHVSAGTSRSAEYGNGSTPSQGGTRATNPRFSTTGSASSFRNQMKHYVRDRRRKDDTNLVRQATLAKREV